MERIVTIAVMAVFYAAYFTKAALQRREGVKTMILGKGDKPERERRIELALKATTILLPFIELGSIWWDRIAVPDALRWGGIAVATVGVACFIAGMATMRDSWRAGIPEHKETGLVTNGIYRFSRNPAFLGFDLLYLGILAAFPNIFHAAAVLLALYLLDR